MNRDSRTRVLRSGALLGNEAALADEVEVMIPVAQVADAVATGKAEIGIQQVVERLPVNGVTVVGSLPAEVQSYTVLSRGHRHHCEKSNRRRGAEPFSVVAERGARNFEGRARIAFGDACEMSENACPMRRST